MSWFDDYAGKYSHIRTERREGVLEITFHTEGRTMAWGCGPHGAIGRSLLRHQS